MSKPTVLHEVSSHNCYGHSRDQNPPESARCLRPDPPLPAPPPRGFKRPGVEIRIQRVEMMRNGDGDADDDRAQAPMLIVAGEHKEARFFWDMLILSYRSKFNGWYSASITLVLSAAIKPAGQLCGRRRTPLLPQREGGAGGKGKRVGECGPWTLDTSMVAR